MLQKRWLQMMHMKEHRCGYKTTAKMSNNGVFVALILPVMLCFPDELYWGKLFLSVPDTMK